MPTTGALRWVPPIEPKNDGVAEGEDAAVGGHQPVARAVIARRHPDDRRVEVGAAHRAVERGVAEGEHAPVGGHRPVALAVRRRSGADDGRIECHAPVDPWNRAPPNEKTPPSEATRV